ncbi:MAG TPA: hypothetical protein VGP89_12000 [Candidatus Angelobacter sp.]|jgi:hypothetical protein|nr:hypothetical protein [Candidatus Angelobacter sp.]
MPAAKPVKKKTTATTGKAAKPDFAAVFASLRKLLGRFLGEIQVQTDKPGNYHTEIPTILHRGKPLYFAGLRTGKNYVSFHLLPLYFCPELLKGMSPVLKKRMQGKACFNFAAVDEPCFAELSRLTSAGLKKFRSKEFLQMLKNLQ